MMHFLRTSVNKEEEGSLTQVNSPRSGVTPFSSSRPNIPRKTLRDRDGPDVDPTGNKTLKKGAGWRRVGLLNSGWFSPAAKPANPPSSGFVAVSGKVPYSPMDVASPRGWRSSPIG